jgi:hypothetical protein
MLTSIVDQAQDISEHHFGENQMDTEASYKNGYAPSSRKKLYRDKEDKSLRELCISDQKKSLEYLRSIVHVIGKFN